MQERGEGYTPSEAEDFSMKRDSKTETYGPTTEEGRQTMRGNPEDDSTG